MSKFVTYSKLVREKKLIEQNFGDWSGKKISEVWEILNKNKTKHNFSFISPEFSPPNGESFLEVLERVQTCVRELTLKFKGEDIICIAHGGPIRAAIALALGLNGDQAMSFSIDNLSTTIIDYIHPENGFHGGWRVGGTNLPSV